MLISNIRKSCLMWSWVLVILTLVTSEAFGQTTWDPERYIEFVVRANELAGQADSLPVGSAERARILLESAESRARSLDMLRSALSRGQLDRHGADVLTQARSDLYHGYTRLVFTFTDLFMCNEAQAIYDLSMRDVSLMPPEHADGVAEWRTRIASCQRLISAADEPEVVAEVEEPEEIEVPIEPDETVGQVDQRDGPEEELAPEGGVPILPWALIGGGAALVVGGFVNDLTLTGTVDEFRQLRDECAVQLCDGDRLLDLQDSVESGQLITLGLWGAGLITATAGVILLLLADDDPSDSESTVSYLPYVIPGGFGFQFSGTF